MDVNLLMVLNSVVLPALALLGFIIRRLYIRLEDTVPRREIRTMIDDKIEPGQVLLRTIDARLKIIESEQRLIFREIQKRNERNDD